MKRLIPLFICFACAAQFCFAQVNRSVHQMFDPEEEGITQVAFDGDIYPEIEEWDGSQIMLEQIISVEGIKRQTLDKLIEVGRYELISSQSGSTLRIGYKKKLSSSLVIGGRDVYETITYKLYLPEGVASE